MLRLSTEDELNNLPMPTVEVEVYHVWWEFDTDTFPPLSLLTFPHHGGILSWWEYAGKPSSSSSSVNLTIFMQSSREIMTKFTVSWLGG